MGSSSVLTYPRKSEDLPRLWEELDDLLAKHPVGAILAEPIQGRGGVIVPPAEFLPGLRYRADGQKTVLILDEIYTGFSRTGKAFACEHDNVTPDLLCLGKGLTGAFPLSVCLGTPEVMASWPVSTGEAIHTSTFLGNPRCALGIRSIELIKSWDFPSEQAPRERGPSAFEDTLADTPWVLVARARADVGHRVFSRQVRDRHEECDAGTPQTRVHCSAKRAG